MQKIMGDASTNAGTLLDLMCAHAIMGLPFMRMVMTAKKVAANMRSQLHMARCRLRTTQTTIHHAKIAFGILQPPQDTVSNW